MTMPKPKSSPPKPNVMIVIATDIIGGPGKGLFQFLRFSDHRRFDYLLCNYDRAGWTGYRNDFLDMARDQGIQVHRFYQRFTIDPLLVLQAYRTIKANGINIVQTHSYKSNILGFLLKRMFGIPWIAFAHGYTGENKKVALYNRLDLWCYQYADLAVVVSDPLKRLLQSKGTHPQRIIKLPNAVDRRELTPQTEPQVLREKWSIDAERPVIAVIGRLSPEKGQMVFLQAFQEAGKRIEGLQALIIGDGQELENLQQFCRENGMAEDVIFTGHVTNVGDYYRLIDLLVIPSYSEGLPNVLLEAMALGVPVVSTKVGAVGEVLQGMEENMVTPGDHYALAERISTFLADPDLKQRSTTKAGKIITRRYNPKMRAERLVSLYDRILRRQI